MNENELLEVYFEETSENLQEAERCMIGLEESFSMEELNSLFRCIHTIKGSSAAVDFNEISTLAHKLEDILNYVRDGQLEFNLDNSNICFSSIDKLLELFDFRRRHKNDDIDYDIIKNNLELEEHMDQLINNVKEDKENQEPIIITNPQKEEDFNEEFSNTYYIHMLFDVKDIMQSITRFMIINSMNENGRICYSNPEIDFMISMDNEEPVTYYECLFKTNIDSEVLLNKLDIPFVKGVNIINVTNEVSGSRELADCNGHLDFLIELLNDFFAIEKYYGDNSWSTEIKMDINNLYKKIQHTLELAGVNEEVLILVKELSAFVSMQVFMVRSSNDDLMELFHKSHSLYECLICKIYNTFKNKIIFKYVELQEDKENIERLDNISSKLNKKIFKYVFLDVSKVDLLESDELKKLIKVNNLLKESGIEMIIINGGKYSKRLYNIFEAINDFNNVKQYKNEMNAVLFFKK